MSKSRMRLIMVALAALLAVLPALADDVLYRTFPFAFQSAAAANGNGTSNDVGALGTVVFVVSGTFSATINFEATADNARWDPLQVSSISSGTTSTTATAPGTYWAPVAGLSKVRARISGYASGTVTVTGRGAQVRLNQPAAASDSGSGGAATRLVLTSSVDQSVPSGSATLVQYPTVVQNDGGFTVSSDTSIIVPSSGSYRVWAEAKCSDGGGPLASLQVFADGAEIGQDQRLPTIPASALAGIANLQAFFSMGESSGPCIDAVASVSASQIGGDQVVTGRPGSGYANARNNTGGHYIDLGGHYLLTGAYTFAAWLYITSHTGNYATVWAKNSDGGDWDFLITPSGNLRLYHPGGNLSGGTTLPTGQWIHVALVRASNGSTIIYLNGSSDGSGTTSAMPSSGFSTIHVGDSPSFPGRNPNAYFSDLSIYSRDLTSTEIGNLISYAHSAITGNVMAVSIPGAPAAGQTFLAGGYCHGLAAGDSITVRFYHEKGSPATLLGGKTRIIVEKI